MQKPAVKVTLKSGKDASLRRFHPWVFSGAIDRIHGTVEEGDLVEVYDNKENYLGTGHCQIGTIAIRVFAFKNETINYDFWKDKLQRAYDYRKNIGLIDAPSTNVYRLFYAEGDGLPGLIIDYYNGTAVLQTHSIGMHLVKNHIVDALKEIYGDKLNAVYDKSEETMPKQSEIKAPNGYLFGKQHSTEVAENDHKFLVDWEGGQKTGFFVDQRESRELLSGYSRGRSVLNTFCYTGGFSIYAAKAGASVVHSVDSSKKAIELTNRNMELNGFPTAVGDKYESFAIDTFDFLKDKQNAYDIIVLDPPAFAKHQNVKHNAIMGYKRLNYEAIKQIKPGGLIFTFSCSQVVDRYSFNSAVMAAAIEAGRNVRIVHQLSQPPDHPVNIFHPEGEYLKGLVVYVE
ncbi:MAG: class I SAM-dependent rRNA methyltransferase [Bacteroidetes bacterium]|nr:class I SAM-dependent rRNA methyltransferase [Bacteroidota bacterium]